MYLVLLKHVCVSSRRSPAKITARNVFHVRPINVSYRIRGYAPRTHKKKAAIKVVFVVVIPPVVIYAPKKRVTVTIERRRILPYSAMKRSANSPPPYSMLNPETNSLSPSARSNGARFVSANLLVNHIKKRGGERNANQIV